MTENKSRYTIEEIRRKIIPIAEKYGVNKLWIFGSYARGEADSDSDIDILIERGKIRGMQYFGFVLELETEFKCHVDVVVTGSSDKNFLDEIQSDEVMLYASE